LPPQALGLQVEHVVRRAQDPNRSQPLPEFSREAPQRWPGRSKVEQRLFSPGSVPLRPAQEYPEDPLPHRVEAARRLFGARIELVGNRFSEGLHVPRLVSEPRLKAAQRGRRVLRLGRLDEVERIDLVAVVAEARCEVGEHPVAARRFAQLLQQGLRRRVEDHLSERVRGPHLISDRLEVGVCLKRLGRKAAQEQAAGQAAVAP
jgi:hypothetical protein